VDRGRALRVAAIQQGPRTADRTRNVGELVAAIDDAAAAAELVVATELSTTPYFCGGDAGAYRKWADPVPGPVTDAVAACARRHGVTVVLPLFVRGADGAYTNSAVVIGSDGEPIPGVVPGRGSIGYFSKVHLPRIESETLVTDETAHFTAGDAFPVFETPKAIVGVLICYDRRFPEAWRELALAGAEVVVMPACVPAWDPAEAASSADTFVGELRTRACENGVFVVACNRVGTEEIEGRRTTFFGRSCVLGPGGTLVAEGPTDAAAIVRAELDLAEVARTRARLPLLRDRRPETYVRIRHEGASA
jgi:N-carbamoylputrescine amidase